MVISTGKAAGTSEASISTDTHWARGELFGIDFPADAAALDSGGKDFLTRAFHTTGVLPANNNVSRILHAEEFFGGGTGSKLILKVEYSSPAPDLPDQLFIKFSRNFNDELRDRARYMMISETKFAALSRSPDFPVTVPFCLFADVEVKSGTGLLITECLEFGRNGLEVHYPKCMDYTVPEPLEHYKAIMRALAKLSGTYKAGGLSPEFDKHFPQGEKQNSGLFSAPITVEKTIQRATRMLDFIHHHPQLFPDNIRAPEFHQQFLSDIPHVIAAEDQIKELLASNPDFIALCHCNANIDNCWFWRDAKGTLHCGLMDWAMVGQMSVVQTINGAISGAEQALWDTHLDDILQVFINEYAAHGGPMLDLAEVRLHLLLSVASGGLAYGMGAPVAIGREITDLDGVESYQDECFRSHENSRIQLHMMTKMLNIWQTRNLGQLVRQSFQ